MRRSRVSSSLLIVAFLLCGGSTVEPQSEGPATSSRLFVQASLSTAGPYGQNWYLTLAPDGRLWVEVFFSIDPQGSLIGNFSLTEENMKNLRDAVHTAGFFSLPKEILPSSPVPLHMPDFRMEIELGDQSRKVSLYSPKDLKGSIEAKRFLDLWQKLIAPLPFKPTW